MASHKDYLDYILDALSLLDEITYRSMMGEYILYYRGKIFGGIYDDRFLVKETPSSKTMIHSIKKECPYAGAKEMILIEEIDNKEFLKELIENMYEELPFPKKRK
jgi:TfoX/Sxy family transcriptional regulator of competence genes